MADRCADCDGPCIGGECARTFNECQDNRVDWRARALAAEATLVQPKICQRCKTILTLAEICNDCWRAQATDWERRALSAEQAAEEWRRTATGAFKARDVWATAYDTRYSDIERDIVERIAVWLDAIGKRIEADAIRSGAWKEKP